MGKDRDPGDLVQHPQSSTAQPLSPQRNSKMQAVRVRLPDGQFREFELDRGSEGEILFRQVTADLSIEEREYFSLCFYDKTEGARHWLYNDKKILAQLKGLPWEFSFETKFYPTTPSTLVDDHARYYLFLQLRRDILTERLPATSATHALLGSFVAQIEYGDAPSQISDDYEKFIVGSRLVPDSEGSPEVFKQIAELHRELRGRTTSEAENLYLDHCRQLALFGIHLFPAKDKKGDAVNIGIGSAGVNIYKGDERVHHFGWQNINKISYRKTYFSVKLKAGELGKKETRMDYKLVDYQHAKRVWKCAVEHHTFFRLIQPDDKPKSSFMHFGSQRFHYSGRTQFQTKMASQMFDRPSNVERSSSAMSQPIDATRQVLSPLHYTDNEMEHQNFEKFRRTLTPKSYTQDDTISNATFAKYSQRSRPNTLIVSTSGRTSQNLDESLSYSPRGQAESPQSSGAAYYLSDRSSLRTPTSTYYPASDSTPYSSGLQSPNDGYYEGQSRGEYNVEMRSKTTGGARRNLFGRSSGTSNDTVRLVSFHEPVDSSKAIPSTYPTSELPQIPIERIVHVYHEGHYDRLSPGRERRPDLPYGFGIYTPRNGVTHVDRLEPRNEMDQQPIRFFVDVKHSGISKRSSAKRLSHPGKEDVSDIINPKNYEFSAASTADEVHRIELAREVQPANIKQYTRIYHSGSSNQPSTSSAPPYRLVTQVNPLLLSNRDARDRETASNVNATISQKEQIVSTRVRRESPDSDRRLRLSASVDRSGNVTETTQKSPTTPKTRVLEQITVTEVQSTSASDYKDGKQYQVPSMASDRTEVTFTQHEVVEMPRKTVTRDIRITTATPLEKHSLISLNNEKSTKKKGQSSSKFGFFGRTTKTEKSYPTTSEHYAGDLDTIDRNKDLENIPFDHQFNIPAYSPKKNVADVQEKPLQEKPVAVVEEEKRRYRLIARFRHEGDEDEVDKEKIAPEAYGFASTAYEGPLDETSRQNELDQTPIGEHSTVYHHGRSWIKDEPIPAPIVEEKKQMKAVVHVKSPKKEKIVEPVEPETREVRLIARIKPDEPEPTPVATEKTPKKKDQSSSKFGFFSRTTKTEKAYPTTSEHYAGDLDTIDRNKDLENIPFDHQFNIPAYSPKKNVADVQEKPLQEKPVAVVEEEKRRYRLIARFRHEGDEDEVDKEKIAPEAYGFASTAYEGPLDETSRQNELDQTPIGEHSTVYHHGRSWIKDEPIPAPIVEEKKQMKAVVHVKSPKKEKIVEPVEPETREVRLIARIKPDEPEPTPVTTEKTPKKKDQSSSKFGFFSRTTKTEKAYPTTSEHYAGDLDTIDRNKDLENIPFDHQFNIPAYSPKKNVADVQEKPLQEKPVAVVEEEKRRYRLIARFRHEGDEDEVDKEKIAPEAYGFASTAYEGPLDETSRQNELDQTPIGEHSTVYHHGRSWIKDEPIPAPIVEEKKQKKAVVHVKSPKKEKIVEPVEPETREVRLIARIKPDEPEPTPVATEKTPKKKDQSSSKFGFFSRTTKTEKAYPTTSEHYAGDLDTIDRNKDLENIPFDHQFNIPAYSPKKNVVDVQEKPLQEKPVAVVEEEKRRYRLIARFRHEGDEDEVDKEKIAPEAYGFASTAYEGPLDETSRQNELDQTPIGEHSTVYHHGRSWIKDEPIPAPIVEEKKQKKAVVHVKSPKKEKIVEPVEPETREVRLIARIKPDEPEPSPTPVTTEKTPKKKDQSSSKFGFFSRTTKTEKAYPTTSEHYAGDLDTIDRNKDLENIPFDHQFNIPAYSPKKNVVDVQEKPLQEKPVAVVEEEKRRYRLIARFRHEGDEDEVDKEKIAPEAYGFASTAYEGPLDETSRQNELDQTPIGEHSTVYHHGRSWIKDEPIPAPIVEEKKQKKAVVHVKSPKKEKIVEPVEPETREVRLIARIKPDEPEPSPTPVTTEKTPKKKDQSSSKFGFFSRTTKTEKAYPTTSEHYAGDLDTIDRKKDLENIPFDHQFNIPAYSPKKNVVDVQEKPLQEKPVAVVEEEKRRYRLIARFRHEGDEDEVDKEKIAPEAYGFASTAYEGPLDETSRQNELDQTPIGEHSTVYHHGRSWIKDEPIPAPIVEEKKQKKAVVHVKSPKKEKIVEPVEPETREVRLIARIKPDEPEPTPVATEKTPKKKDQSSSKFGFFSRTTKTEKAYPTTSEHYAGDLDTIDRNKDLENIPFDHQFNIPAYSPKKNVADVQEKPVAVVETEKRRYRLIARFRHEGDEDEVDKEKIAPEAYGFASTAYEGPLDETSRQNELDQTPIGEHSTVYHHGRSWIKDEPIPAPVVEEKKQKKAVVHVKSPKKEKIVEPVEPETREVRLIARIKPDEPEPTPVATEKTPKKKDQSSSKFGFFSRTTKTEKAYPTTSEHYAGDLDTIDRNKDLENIPFDHQFNIPAYSPKKNVVDVQEKPLQEKPVAVVEEEKRRYRLIARFRHEGDEDEVDKEKIAPEAYGFASTAYEGPLDETSRQNELDQTPIGEHSTVYHHGRSWIKDEPIPAPIVEEKKQKKAVVHVKSPKKEKIVEPVEPETREVRLIARIKPDEPEPSPTPVTTEKTPKKKDQSSSKFGFFSRTTKTEKAYPTTSEHYAGDLDTIDRNKDLENIPFDHQFNIPAYSPKKNVVDVQEKPLQEKPVAVVEEEKRRYRLIARFRHEGDEDEVDKEKIAPEAYGFASTAYEGPLDETSRQNELDQTPIGEHSTVYHHGRSWIKDEPIPAPIVEEKKQKKAVVHVKSPKKEKIVEPVEPETREVRLIARIKPDEPEPSPTPVTTEKTPKKKDQSSSKFGFFSRTTKTEKAYPTTSEHYAGDLDTIDRNKDLENIPFDHQFNIPAYSPKKNVVDVQEKPVAVVEEEKRRYRLIARFRHEGDEDEVDKEKIAPEAYGFASTAYEGPLDETSRQNELDQTPIGEHSTVYHHGRSWIKDEPIPAPIVEEKKQKKAVVHVKSPKKEKIVEPVEPETREVRLIARIKPDEPEPTPVATEKTPKKKDQSSSKFGFFSRTTKTEKAYPTTSEHYAGDLDTIDRNKDLENIPFDHQFNIPAYSPKKNVVDVQEKPVAVVEEEKRRYRLIARFRHEGDEDEVDKEKIAPEAYGFASTAYEGPLDETSRQNELDQTPIGEHSTVYHHGRSWIKDEPIPAPIVEEKKQKKAVVHVKSPKKEKIVEPVEPETREVRLIARIKPDEPEPSPTPVTTEKTPKKKDQSSSKFGFFSRTTKTEKAYPTTSEHYAGDLDTIDRNKDLENIPFDHQFNIPAYSPKKNVVDVQEKPLQEKPVAVVEEEKRRYRLIARFRHEGDEDEVDKEKIAPEAYGFASTAYEGPLDETSRQNELDQTPIGEHSTVYHHGQSWIKDEPIPAPIVEEKKQKKAVVHVKSPKKEKIVEPVEPETREVRLIARIKPDEPEPSPTPVTTEKTPKKKDQSSSKFGFFSRTTKTEKAYPTTSEHYAGDLDTIDRNKDLENIPFDHQFNIPAYSPKKNVADVQEKPVAVVEEEKRRYRLIARFRHEGDEDEVDKEKIAPEAYGFASTAYEGPLDETSRQNELDQTPIGEHSTVYHHGRSWIKDEPIPAPIVEEKKQKKAVVHVKSPKKEKIVEPVEPETREVRLIARIKPDEPEPTPVATEKTPKKKDQSSSKFGFFSRTTKTEKAYPTTSEHYAGDLDTIDRNKDLENIPFDHQFNIPAYSPKKNVVDVQEKPLQEKPVAVVEEEKRRYRLIARFRHEGDEDEVDKEKIAPEAYGFASTAYEGPLDETSRQNELDQTPIGEHSTVYHHGRSWIKDEPIPAPIVEEKKQKKAVVHVKSPKKEKIVEPVEPETREVRLIARIKPDEPEPSPTPVATEKTPKKKDQSSSKFGFFSRTTKTEKAYPTTSEHYAGDLDTIDRNKDLENIPFDHQFNIPAYSPKKNVVDVQEKPVAVVEEEKRRYRLIARFRHEGDEDEVDKEKIAPEAYGFASTAYEGPLDETSRQNELDQTPIGEHSTVYHHGRSWIKDEPIPAPIVEEKKQKKAVVHVKSPKKEKIVEPVEPETREVRLIARIKPDEPEPTPVATEKTPKKKDQSSSKFGFFSRTTKTEKAYPTTSEHYAGDLDTIDRNKDLENIPFDHQFNIPAYSPKKNVVDVQEKPLQEKPVAVVEEEKRRYRLIARFRHEGDEDEVDKEKIAPEAYGFASTAYEGPLDETSRQNELDQTPIGEHSTVYHHGRSWIKDEPIPAPIVEEKKQKKAVVHVKSPKKEKIVEPVEPETREVRLIARIKPDEPEPSPTPVTTEKTPKKKDQSSSKFGFFSRTTKTEKAYPTTSEHYAGDLDTIDRNKDLENIPFDHQFNIPAYSPKKNVVDVQEKPLQEKPVAVVEEEKRRYRLIARFRHEGDEDEVDKEKIAPEAYGFASTAYEGPLDETSRQNELDQTPIGEHSTVYHHGRSWIKDEPIPAPIVEEKKQKKAVVHVKSPKKEKIVEPVEPETREVRLIARIKPDEPEPSPTPVTTEKTPKKKDQSSSKFGFFSRTTKTEKAYPTTSEHYAGDLDTIDRNKDLENIPFDHQFNIPAYSPKKNVADVQEKPVAVVEEEKRRYRLIARFRHEGDEDEVDKEKIAPEAYGFASTAYEGPLDETSRQNELDQTPIGEHSTVYHHGRSWIKDEPIPAPIVEEKKQKKAVVHVKSPKKEKIVEPVEPETREVRLIARIKPDEPEPTPVATEKTPKKKDQSSSKFGFFSRTTKTEKAYPTTSEHYAGDLDTIDRNKDLENIPFDHQFNIPAYSPKKNVVDVQEKPLQEKPVAVVEEEKRRYRLIARFRHEGDEDEVDKEKIAPEAYGFASTAYEGPLDETSRQNELDQTPIGEHSTVYHHGRSWIKDEPIPAPIVEEKKQKKAVVHVKSPKKEKIVEPVEPETREVRLIARIKPDEPEPSPTPVATEKTPKKKDQSSSKFGFFSRTTKTEKAYPTTSEHYAGDLDTIDRNKDLENIPFDHQFNIPAYSPKKNVADVQEKPLQEKPVAVVEEEKRRYRLIARFRHEGDEDEVDKEKIAPEAYGFASTAYEGPLDETSRQNELDQTPIGEHSTVYHHGRSWIKDEPIPAPIVEEKKQKKAVVHVKSPKKEKIVEPVEPKTREVRLIARIKPDEPEPTPVATEKTPKKKDQSSSKFGFFSRTTKTEKAYPTTSEHYAGDLDTIDRNKDLENIPFDHQFNIPAYSPKKNVADVQEKPLQEKPVAVVEEEKRRYRLIARFRHEGDEDEVDKEKIAPEAYGFASTAYEGPLDETSRQNELDQTPIGEHSIVYHHGRSWIKDEPIPAPIVEEKKQKKAVVHVKSPKKEKIVEPVEPETREVRLIARIKPDEPEPTPDATEKTPKKKDQSSSKFGFFSRTTKTEKAYPTTSEHYAGNLDTIDRNKDLENIPFDHQFNIPAYSPKKNVADVQEKPLQEKPVAVVEEEKRRYRLIARFRHEGDEDEVDKEKIAPEAYGFASTAYEGPLDETSRQNELDQTPIGEHSTVYHHGRSWIKDEPIPAPIVEEKKQKKAVVHVKSPKKEKIVEPVEPETREVRLIARIKPDEPEPTPVTTEKTPKKKDQSSSKFGFFSRTTKTEKAYPTTSEHYAGDLDTIDRNKDLENIPFDHQFNIPAYSPKKNVADVQEKTVAVVEEEKRRYRLIARFRHEGDEDEVDKEKIAPEAYGFASTAYEGPLDETSRRNELDQTPIGEHSTVYHHGRSWIKDEPISAPIVQEKKKVKKAVLAEKSYNIDENTKPDVRLVARVLPMKKDNESATVNKDAKSRLANFWRSSPARESYPSTSAYSGDLETIRRSEELEAMTLAPNIGPSTSRSHVVERTVSYFPSSLQYEPRPSRIEGFTEDGNAFSEVRFDRRFELQIEPVYVLRETTERRSHAYRSTATAYFSGAQQPFISSVSEDEAGILFTSTPPMSPPEKSLLARLGFKRDKNKKAKKGKKENDSSETSDSDHDEKREFAVVEFQPADTKTQKQSSSTSTPRHRPVDEPMNEVTVLVTGGDPPAELGETKVVREERREHQFRLTGDGFTSGFNPNDPSLMATIQRAERLNSSSPRLEHAERTFTVRANAPLPLSFEESGQPFTTVSTWQETSDLPEQVEVYTDENGRQVTRTVKSSQVKHTVQTQKFQNYIVDGDQVPVGVVDVERSREQLTPVGQQGSSNGNGIVETQTRTMTYESQGGESSAPPGWAEQGLGEYVSSKSVTQGNRTIETITYKTEKDGVIETHVEHRVTIHSDGDIDHDAELSQAIMEATQMNPDMVVEKIEVRQETTQ